MPSDDRRILTKEFLLLSDFCDRYGRWKPANMLVAMQELAGEHSERLGVGREPLLQEGAIWVLTRSEMHIARYPYFLDRVVAHTFPAPSRRALYPRYYTFETPEGEPLVNAVSYWTIMDLATQHMTGVPLVDSRMPDTADIPRPMGYPGSVHIVPGEQQIVPYQPVYADLDLNGHVNNTRCADWITNLLGSAVLRHTPIGMLLINYLREIRGDAPLTFSYRLDEGAFSLRCLRGDQSCVDVGGTLMPADDPGARPSPVAFLGDDSEDD